MKSLKAPNPKLLPRMFGACCLCSLWIAVGCSNPRPLASEAESSLNNGVLIGHRGERDSKDLNDSFDAKSSPHALSTQSLTDSNAPRSQCAIPSSPTTERRPPILAVQLEDSTAHGIPIGLFADQTLLMRNDGSIQRIQNTHIVRQSILHERFRPIDRAELANQLRSEFGRNYLVRSEAPYTVVARAEHLEVWQKRLRGLFHSFRLYCDTHNIAMREIEFPLVAVVFGSQSEFQRYASATGTKLPANCAGFYFSDSNRIALFESSEMSIQETQATICHEATHQIAFNVGLHQRAAVTPLWVVEGLASMFESPKYSGLQSREGKSRWPTSRRSTWSALAKKPEALQRLVGELVQTDIAFKYETQNAYCVAWAMTIYLSQRQSQQFGLYLQSVGNREPFQPYSSSQRAADFENAFGMDSRLLTKKIIQFLESMD